MKYWMVSVALFCSVSGSRSLKAGDDYATVDGLAEALRRQLKVVVPAKCSCHDGYTMRDGTCVRSVESEPEEVCQSGRMVDGLCVTPAPPVLQCPEDHVTACKGSDRAESPCCAKAETAEKVARCRDGTEDQDGQCTRMLARAPVIECPPDHALSVHGTQCVKQEFGEASPMCTPPDVLSPEGDSCLTTVEHGSEYICPDGYECVARSLKKHKHYSPICSACAKTLEEPATCGCEEDQEEFDGSCYEAGTSEFCRSGKAAPRKQAPPTKYVAPQKNPAPTKEPDEPEVNCRPLGHPRCTCNNPSYTVRCADNMCTCVNREVIPVIPVCRGETDEDGNCITHVKKRLLYQCAEGFTCDVVNKKGRCKCARVTTAEPTKRCDTGEPHEDKCIEVIREPKLLDCPRGYTEICCDNVCSCTKTTLATREVKCAAGAVNIQGECAFVSRPSAACDEGVLNGEKCIQDFMAPPICG